MLLARHRYTTQEIKAPQVEVEYTKNGSRLGKQIDVCTHTWSSRADLFEGKDQISRGSRVEVYGLAGSTSLTDGGKYNRPPPWHRLTGVLEWVITAPIVRSILKSETHPSLSSLSLIPGLDKFCAQANSIQLGIHTTEISA